MVTPTTIFNLDMRRYPLQSVAKVVKISFPLVSKVSSKVSRKMLQQYPKIWPQVRVIRDHDVGVGFLQVTMSLYPLAVDPARGAAIISNYLQHVIEKNCHQALAL